MGIGSALGWLWERVHRSRRQVRPEGREAGVIAHAPVAPPAGPGGRPNEAPVEASAIDVVASAGPKTLVIIFGPPAVGKMTVGDALARRTGLRLFHNHLTIDLVLRFFEFGTPQFSRLVSEFRTRVFEEVAASALPGMIFTYVWALDEESDTRFVERLSGLFRARGADVFLVELEATLPERLRRNETEFRLAEKKPKRDTVRSRALLLEHDEKYRLNSRDEFAGRSDYLRIDNTELSPEEVAERIIDRFGLHSAPMEAV